MANPDYPAVKQAFTFAGRELVGYLLGFTTKNTRRHVIHEFVKRKGARVEDMDRGPQRLDVKLVFTGDNCAKEYTEFQSAVDKNPFGLLVHPIAGRFQAFCEGPNDDVDLSRAINEIQVRCSWIESELDRDLPRDVPDIATAAQNATAQATVMQQAAAIFMGVTAKAAAFQSSTIAKLDATMEEINASVDTASAAVTSPIDTMITVLSTIRGEISHIIGKVLIVGTKAKVLAQDAADFVASTSDIFDGQNAAAVSPDNVANQLGVVVASGEALDDAMIDTQATPAGAAEAVGQNAELVASCYVLAAAVDQALPPTVDYTVTELTDVISLVMKLYPDLDQPLARASTIMSMNRILNPAAIVAGTVLRVPTE